MRDRSRVGLRSDRRQDSLRSQRCGERQLPCLLCFRHVRDSVAACSDRHDCHSVTVFTSGGAAAGGHVALVLALVLSFPASCAPGPCHLPRSLPSTLLPHACLQHLSLHRHRGRGLLKMRCSQLCAVGGSWRNGMHSLLACFLKWDFIQNPLEARSSSPGVSLPLLRKCVAN